MDQYESFLIDCYVRERPNDGPLFFQANAQGSDGKDLIAARLKGYAIIPLEEYQSLRAASTT